LTDNLFLIFLLFVKLKLAMLVLICELIYWITYMSLQYYQSLKKITRIGPPVFFLLIVREQLKDLSKEYDKSENDLKALQSVGQV